MLTTLHHAAPREIILLDGAGEKRPPSEVLIFPFGEIKTLKGTFRFTKKSAELVTAQWKKLGRQFGFDFEHDAFNPSLPGNQKVAAGWGDLEIRASGLWCVRISWIPEAAEKIRTKAFRYLSPAFNQVKGEIVSVENTALTNLPATLNPKPLMLSRKLGLPVSGPSGSAPLIDTQINPQGKKGKGSTARTHLPGSKEISAMADTEDMADTKHMALANKAGKCMTNMLSAAQEMSESEHPGMKEMGGKLAGMMPEHMAALKEMFPQMGMEPDGDEDMEEEKKGEKMSALLSVVQEITGCEDIDAMPGALMMLSSQAKRKVQAVQLSEQDAKTLKVQKLVKLGKIHPQDKAAHLKLSLASLNWIEKNGAQIGPQGPQEEIEGGVTLNGKPPSDDEIEASAEAVQLARQDAAQLLGVSPEELKALKLG